ncbi:hypothetical protein OG402_40405 [Streptomyces anulatus]|uniref:hypothetical protein n=1 Tax=Streptomyces TaxID=1883 RepID=UPI001111C8C9|nr:MULTISPECIES: hypothetical protein [Streptomyces]MCX4523665.1 hypothetical protein [Streptomyces anulatus]MCX4523794.1 hypothetical protein [Streptomyces anulatus]MCX4606695.1 hypothetical protein [Streptomyces anulatus]
MDDLVRFLRDRNMADNHTYAEVAHRFGSDALLDSHLPMLDLIDMLARQYEAMRFFSLATDRVTGRCEVGAQRAGLPCR